MSQVVHATHFIVQLRVDHQVEVIVNLLNLCEVLVLHSTSSLALGAVLARVGKKYLVDYNVMDVNLLFGKLDRQAFSFVHGEELGDANGHECCLTGVFELLIHILNLGLHGVNTIEHTLLDFFWTLRLSTVSARVHHGLHLVEHATEFVFKFDQFD